MASDDELIDTSELDDIGLGDGTVENERQAWDSNEGTPPLGDGPADDASHTAAINMATGPLGEQVLWSPAAGLDTRDISCTPPSVGGSDGDTNRMGTEGPAESGQGAEDNVNAPAHHNMLPQATSNSTEERAEAQEAFAILSAEVAYIKDLVERQAEARAEDQARTDAVIVDIRATVNELRDEFQVALADIGVEVRRGSYNPERVDVLEQQLSRLDKKTEVYKQAVTRALQRLQASFKQPRTEQPADTTRNATATTDQEPPTSSERVESFDNLHIRMPRQRFDLRRSQHGGGARTAPLPVVGSATTGVGIRIRRTLPTTRRRTARSQPNPIRLHPLRPRTRKGTNLRPRTSECRSARFSASAHSPRAVGPPRCHWNSG